MSIIKFNRRFPMFNQFFPDMLHLDPIFTDELTSKNNWIPSINVIENEKNFEIEVAAPGFGKKDFNVSIDENVLIISAESKNELKENEEKFTRHEFYYNSFERSFTLPNSIDLNKEISAKYNSGVLRIHLEKLVVLKNEEHRKIIEIA
ncbi:Hsp20/alpha crystallin family protein [Lutibacter sp.]|uniref:Hsp20/alpha crystallin family protein n=1 Tax=Lutibacter sp. TaxID=1925666 RepID=UPI0025BDBDC9|nr:Hsp20/alpha crystallin family protein [Lutibacter sp.]MCF6181776.1 Hsp20/alpha crystallin family protein [Lutibacter sp.]